MSEALNSGKIRKHIVFTGMVQGVGFRRQASKAASLFDCTGWVKNEWDGSVSMEIQSTNENINRVILAIEQGSFVYIENMTVDIIPVVEYEYGFKTK